MIEGSGTGRPKNIWIRRSQIRNTVVRYVPELPLPFPRCGYGLALLLYDHHVELPLEEGELTLRQLRLFLLYILLKESAYEQWRTQGGCTGCTCIPPPPLCIPPPQPCASPPPA
jgi:hypothetical protein